LARRPGPTAPADSGRCSGRTRQYIWSINVAFGLVSILAAESLLDGSTLARAVCAFIALTGEPRLAIQLFWFDRSDAPQGKHVRARRFC
jgi:hypothetical protein